MRFAVSFLKPALSAVLIFHSVTSEADLQVVKVGLANVMQDPGSDASIPHGDYFRKGVLLAFEQYAEALKKERIKIEVSNFDYKAGDIDVLNTAIEATKSNLRAVIGYNYSNHVFLAEPIHTKSKLPVITPYGTANRIGKLGSFVFQIPFSNEYQGQILAEVMKKRIGAKKVAIIVAKDCSYCTDLARSVQNTIGLGTERILEYSVLSDQTVFNDLVSSLTARRSEIGAYLIPNTELLSVNILNSLIAAGIRGPFFGGDGWSDYGYRLFKQSLSQRVEAYSITHWDRGLNTTAAKDFLKRFIDRWGIVPYASAALAYDAGSFFATSLIRCPHEIQQAFADCLARTPLIHGSMETFKFSTSSHGSTRGGVLMTLDENKDFVLKTYVDRTVRSKK